MTNLTSMCVLVVALAWRGHLNHHVVGAVVPLPRPATPVPPAIPVLKAAALTRLNVISKPAALVPLYVVRQHVLTPAPVTLSVVRSHVLRPAL